MEEIFLEIFHYDEMCLVPIETLVALFTIKYCDSNIKITLIKSKNEDNNHAFIVNIKDFTINILSNEKLTKSIDCCELPYLNLNPTSYIAGLCACLRQIIKLTIAKNPDHHCHSLLGFKNSCLLAPSETSIWTKFCEIDLISMLKKVNKNTLSIPELPDTLARFESHMSQPARLHNIHKYTMSKKYSVDGIVTQDRSKVPDHVYAEGSFMTLADVNIFVCIHTYLRFMSNKKILDAMPLVSKWYKNIMKNDAIKSCMTIFPLVNQESKCKEFFLPHVEAQSLYKGDKQFNKTGSRTFTKQEDVDTSLKIIKKLGIDFNLENQPFGMELIIDWEKIPHEAGPDGGALPKKRLQRKYEQLENLAKPVLKLAKTGDVICDFCAGSGHLGILVAYLRPDCKVIILENKEESLNRAKIRVGKLKLDNVEFYQCNLDYFKGHFDIGLSLHACGVATDLVIQHCIRRNAVFISCPCCYGSIKNCHHITYPRSEIFKSHVCLKNYLIIGHSADQTHDEKNVKTKQGHECMGIIDTDRKLQAEEFNYKVHLAKLVPDTCTPKNHLLVGIPDNKNYDNIVIEYFDKYCNIKE